MNDLYKRVHGNRRFTAAQMSDTLDQFSDTFSYDYVYNDVLEISTIEFEFLPHTDPSLHEDRFVELLREISDIFEGAVYENRLQWIFQMADGSYKSTEPQSPVVYNAFDTDSVLQLLIEQSGGIGSSYDGVDELFRQQGVNKIYMKLFVIPDDEMFDGAGRKRNSAQMFLTAYPVTDRTRQNGVLVPAPPPPSKKRRNSSFGVVRNDPQKSLLLPRGKIVKDCGTTETLPGEAAARRDCCSRALCFLYWLQYAPFDRTKTTHKIDYGGSSIKTAVLSNYYNNESPGKAIAKSALKLMHNAGISPTSSVHALNGELSKFCTPRALGGNARILVFTPYTTPEGVQYADRSPTLSFITNESARLDVLENAEQIRLQNEADVERGNHESIFDLRESFENRPTQFYSLWLQKGHYYGISNTDVHLLYQPRGTYVCFCFARCLKPHTKEQQQRCIREQESTRAVGSTICIDCGTNRCDALAYSTSVVDTKEDDHTTYCQSCKITFRTEMCYKLHLEEGKKRKGTVRTMLHSSSRCKTRFLCSICETVQTCDTGIQKMRHIRDCAKGLSVVATLHNCGHCRDRYSNAKEFEKHSCWLRKKSLKQRKINSTWNEEVYYVDFETYVIKNRRDNGYSEEKSERYSLDKLHRVNHVCVQSSNGAQKWKFKTILEFILFVFDDNYHRNTGAEDGGALCRTFIAHNGRAYDWLLFLSAVHRHMPNIPYENVTQGAKIMYVNFTTAPHTQPGEDRPQLFDKDGSRLYSQVRLIDSLSFIPRPLASFPSMFGLKDCGAKGWWPHTFNIPEHFDYIGPIPAIKWYEPESFGEKGFAAFWVWYVDQVYLTNKDRSEALLQHMEAVAYLDSAAKTLETKDKLEKFMRSCAQEETKYPEFENEWNFETMLHQYCDQDVTILRLGFNAFRKFTLNLFKNEPKAENRGLDPTHYVSITGLCLDIFLNRWYKPMTLIPFSYNLAEEMRSSFHGGRTGANILLLTLKSFTRKKNPMLYGPQKRKLSRSKACVKAVDLRSSYPFQTHSRPYPVGSPLIFTSAKQFVKYFAGAPTARISQWPGNLKEWTSTRICAFLAEAVKQSKLTSWQHVFDTMILDLFLDDTPTSLSIVRLTFEGSEGTHIPVLPSNEIFTETRTRVNRITGESVTTTTRTNKLVFDLFEHTDQVKTTISLKVARRHSYKFKDVKKIIYWPHDQVQVGLWKDFVNLFYGHKLSAEGWPAGVESDAEKQAYLRKLNRDFPDIDLSEADIVRDAGRYAMSKLLLTSNWGRLVMGSNKSETKVFREACIDEYWALLRDPTKHIHDIQVLSKTACKVRFSAKEEFARLAPKTCVTVGIFTTEWGRDRLYDGMMQIRPEQLIYFDTDSLYYLSDSTQKGWGEVKQGSALGDWSDDLNKVGTSEDKKICIVDFWAGSAKNYGYKKAPLNGGSKKRWDTANHETDIKIKGFNLSRGWLDSNSAQNKLSYDRCVQRIMDGYKDLVQNRLAVPSQEVENLNVRRFLTTPTMDKKTVSAKQSYRFRFDKRQIAPELCQIDTETGLPCLIRTTPYGFSKRRRADGTVIKDYGTLVA